MALRNTIRIVTIILIASVFLFQAVLPVQAGTPVDKEDPRYPSSDPPSELQTGGLQNNETSQHTQLIPCPCQKGDCGARMLCTCTHLCNPPCKSGTRVEGYARTDWVCIGLFNMTTQIRNWKWVDTQWEKVSETHNGRYYPNFSYSEAYTYYENATTQWYTCTSSHIIFDMIAMDWVYTYHENDVAHVWLTF